MLRFSSNEDLHLAAKGSWTI